MQPDKDRDTWCSVNIVPDILVRSQVSGPSSEPGTLLTEVLTISRFTMGIVSSGIFGLVSWMHPLILKITCVFFCKIQTAYDPANWVSIDESGVVITVQPVEF